MRFFVSVLLCAALFTLTACENVTLYTSVKVIREPSHAAGLAELFFHVDNFSSRLFSQVFVEVCNLKP